MTEQDTLVGGRRGSGAFAGEASRQNKVPWDYVISGGESRDGNVAGSGLPAVPASGIHRWRLNAFALVAGLLAILGLVVFFYPSASSWFSAVNQSKVASSYSEQVQQGIDPTVAEQLALAHKYNDALSAGALLEAGERLPTAAGEISDDELDYWSILRVPPGNVMARLRIDVIDVDLPIYHGTSDETLDIGVGHLAGTSLPVGGSSTRSVLTAHRGLATATMFTNLDQVEVGDTFTIEVMDQILTYRVFDKKVIAPDETEALRAVSGKDLVTLVTCTPLGINTHRILITGQRVTPTPIDDMDKLGAAPTVPGFPWWAVFLVGGSCIVIVYVWYAGLPPKRRKHRKTVGRAVE